MTEYLTGAGLENSDQIIVFWERLILQLHQAGIKSSSVSWAFRTNDIIWACGFYF